METSPSIRVMTYNIRFDTPADGEESWIHRRDGVSRLLADQRPDLIGVQEALIGQVRDLAERLPEYSWVGTGRDGGSQGEHCAILYRRSRLQVLRHATFWLSESPESVGRTGWDADVPRIATWALLHDAVSGGTFLALNTHLDHKGAVARYEGSRLLSSTADELAGTLPAVILGDFNCEADSEAYRLLTDRWEDTYRSAIEGHRGPHATFVQSRRVDETAGGRRLDYIFLRGGRAVRHVIVTDGLAARYPSDHLPVLADLEFAAIGD